VAAVAAPPPTLVPAVAPLSAAALAPSAVMAPASGEVALASQVHHPALVADAHAAGEAVAALLVLASQVPAVVVGNLAAESPERRIPPAGAAKVTVEAQARTGCSPAHPAVMARCTSVVRRPARPVAAAPWTVLGLAAMR
jgi:hypothetical protein